MSDDNEGMQCAERGNKVRLQMYARNEHEQGCASIYLSRFAVY